MEQDTRPEGWLAEQAEKAKRDIETWPEWMKRHTRVAGGILPSHKEAE